MRIYRVTLESRYSPTAVYRTRDMYNISTDLAAIDAIDKARAEHVDRWPDSETRALEVVLLAEADL